MLNILLTLGVIVLFYSVALLLANIVERIRTMRGEELDYERNNQTHGKLFVIYGIFFLIMCAFSLKYMEFASLPTPASNWGVEIDTLFVVTCWITGIVFVITHIALFYFVWRYRGEKDKKATFFAHSGKLELIWTTIPALAMAVLVIMGLKTWFHVFPNSKTLPANQMIIEATGKQFNWMLRYPGPDGVFGKRVISKEFVSPDNELGIDWTDPASHDDFFASELYMVKGRPVRFNLGALDVLHSFYLPHFRMKMDCVPGVPTGIGFTPTLTDDETRELLKTNKHWASIDPETNEPRYMKFNYELACAELCGKSHYGMMMPAHVVSQSKFDEWAKSQKPFYIVNKDKIQAWLAARHLTASVPVASSSHTAFNFEEVLKKGIDKDAVYETDAIEFTSGSIELNAKSKGTLDQLAQLLKKNADSKIALAAHTDSDGDDSKNLELSQKRAETCAVYLVSKGVKADRIAAKGYGETQPVADNNSKEGKQKNRRTEFDFN